MKTYTLNLFDRRRANSTTRLKKGRYVFAAADDPAAVKHATVAYAEGLGDCDHAQLLGEDGNVIWEKGSS